MCCCACDDTAPPSPTARLMARRAARRRPTCGCQFVSTVLLSGDLPFLMSAACMGGCSHTYGCLYCKLARKDWFIADSDTVQGALRSWEGQARMAHVWTGVPFTCEGCRKVFATEAEVDAEVGPEKMNTYQHQHFNVIWHHRPLVPTFETRDGLRSTDASTEMLIVMTTPTDPMHLIMRETARVFFGTFCRHMATDADAARLNGAARQIGVSLEKKVAKRTGGKVGGDGQGPTLIGDHCDKVLADVRKGVEHSVLLAAAITDDAEREVAFKAWEALGAFVTLLVDGNTPDTAENRISKAAAVQAAADHYVEIYRDVIGLGEPATFPPYLHIIKCHMADFITYFGTDLKQMSGQGLEHLQKIGKVGPPRHRTQLNPRFLS